MMLCSYCQRDEAPYRCKQCRQRRYCGTRCQRRDWTRQNHRQVCRPFQAFAQLSRHVSSLSLEETQREYQRALSEIDRLKKEESDLRKKAERQKKKAAPPQTNLSKGSNKHHREEKSSTNKSRFVATKSQRQQTKNSVTCSGGWDFVMEETPNLSSLQIYLRRTSSSREMEVQHIPTLGVALEHHRDGSTVVCLFDGPSRNAIWRACLDQTIQSQNQISMQILEDDLVYIRIQVPNWRNSFERERSSLTGILFDSKSLSCRFCGQVLLEDSAAIKQLLPLPERDWEEVADYLTCGPSTSPLLDFTTVSPSPKTAYYDGRLLVIHPNDISPDSVAVLSIPSPYSPQRDSSVAASASPCLCCSRCCASLGQCSDHNCSFLFYQHCLTGTRASTATFVANEIVRAAERQALYTFLIGNEDTNDVLVLQVVSWETRMVCNDDDVVGGAGCVGRKPSPLGEHGDELVFNRVIKVVYEQQQRSDLSSHSWHRRPRIIDLCCDDENDGFFNVSRMPSNDDDAPSAISPHLVLSHDEYVELREALNGGSRKWFLSKTVAEAAVQMKLGFKASTKARLSALELSNYERQHDGSI